VDRFLEGVSLAGSVGSGTARLPDLGVLGVAGFLGVAAAFLGVPLGVLPGPELMCPLSLRLMLPKVTEAEARLEYPASVASLSKSIWMLCQKHADVEGCDECGR
jgi:hypothetical protein